MAALTPAQQRYLEALRVAGQAGKVYNGRARRPLEALRDAGLIILNSELRLTASGPGSWALYAWIIPVTCPVCGWHRSKGHAPECAL